MNVIEPSRMNTPDYSAEKPGAQRALPGGGVASQGTVYVVDDDTSSRELLNALLKRDGYHVVTYSSAEEFLSEYRDDPGLPRCLVTDLCMPSVDGLALQQRLNTHHIRMPVVFVSGIANVPSAVAAMKSGALDFIEKPIERTRLLDCVRQAIEQDKVAARQHGLRQDLAVRMANLTPRERQVLDLLVVAQGTKAIASLLKINVKTVFVHRARVMEKMGVDSLVELSRLVTGVESSAVSAEMTGG